MKFLNTAVFAAAFMLAASSGIQAAEKGAAAAPFPDDIVYTGTGQAVNFSHKAHAGDFGLGCAECHGTVFEVRKSAAQNKGDFTMKSLYEGKYCGTCHNGEKAFASDDFGQCERCHSGAKEADGVPRTVKGPQEPMTFGEGDNVAVFRHGPHESLACGVCHTSVFQMKKDKTITTMDDINNKKACGSCHDGEKAFDATNCGLCHPKM